MEKERRVKTLSLVALIVAVLGLTVAFAAMSATLKINGTATMDAATWDVHFANLSNVTLKGDAKEKAKPNISSDGLFVQNINILLTKPKDEATYTVDIVNDGTINAEITSIEKSTLTGEQAKIFEFDVRYADGGSIEQSNILAKKEKEQVIIKVRFKDDIDASDLPKTSQNINLSLKINYVQADDKVLPPSGGDTSKTYKVGDEVCLGSECFYVIKDNGDSITALAKYNLLVGNTVKIDDCFNFNVLSNTPISSSTSGYGLQNSKAKGASITDTTWTGVLAFADTDENKIRYPGCSDEYGCYYGYWTDNNKKLLPKYGTSYPTDVYDSNSKLYTHVKNYESYLKRRGYKSISTRLITYNEFFDLGCGIGTSDYTCESAPSWVSDTTYWSSTILEYQYIFSIATNEKIGYVTTFDVDFVYGVRPVITISKSEI